MLSYLDKQMGKLMNTLASLKLVSAKKPTRSPAISRRNKLCTRLVEQINLATAQLKGENYLQTRIKTTTDSTGNRIQVTKTKKVKAWWFCDEGKTYLQIKYGARILQLSAKANAIEVANNAAIVTTLETVKTLILAGELDTQIEAASKKIRSGFDG